VDLAANGEEPLLCFMEIEHGKELTGMEF